MNKLYLEMDDTENTIKNMPPLTDTDNLFLLKIARKYGYEIRKGSLLDNFQKEFQNNK